MPCIAALKRLFLFSFFAAPDLFALAADSFSPDPLWRKPNITTSPADRISTADAALQKTISMLTTNALFNDSSVEAPGYLFSQMAEFDLATNQTKYRDQLKQFFPAIELSRPDFQDLFLNYGLIYGYAAARAYAAYKDNVFLDYAKTVWDFGQAFTISPDEAKAGTTGVKEFPISSQCQGITMAGGTFWQTDPAEPSLIGLATGYHFVNSALLAEITGNQTYLTAANLAADFIHSHLYNVNNVVQDTISARANDSCSTSSTVGPYNSGLLIEGLSILAALTGNQDRQSFLLDAIAAAVPSKSWQGDDGVVASGSGKSGDLHLVRGYFAAYTRNNTNYQLRSYLKDYLGVQYNAILDQARLPGSNIYGASWIGPPATTFGSEAQCMDLVPLVGAIYLTNDTIPSNSSDSSDQNGDGKQNGSDNQNGGGDNHPSLAGPIAGGVVGGLCLIALIVALVFFFRRRRQEKNTLGDMELPEPVPFMMTQTREPYNPYDSHTTRSAYGTTSATQSTSVLVPNRRAEKQQPHRPQLSGSTSFTGSSAGAGVSKPWPPTNTSHNPSRSTDQQSPSNSRPSPSQPQELPTSELVRLLNERLQPEQWQPDEVPPEYPDTAVPHTRS